MKLKLKWIIPALLVISIASYFLNGCTRRSALKEGDIVFYISKSNQSSAIQMATMSALSHCGIIIEKKDGLYVLEASHTTRLRPFDQWIKQGKHGWWWAKRVTDKDVKIKYKKYLGRPYDNAFKPDNNLYYCSELVNDIYKKQQDITISEMKPVKEYHLWGQSKTLKRRGINTEQLVVAPSDIFYSSKVHGIW